MTQDIFESVTVAQGEDSVLFRWEDGSAEHVPLDIVFRSTMLEQALSSVVNEDNTTLQLPMGVLRTWLQSMQSGSSFSPEFLTAADFLGDDTYLSEIYEDTAAWLFETETEPCRTDIERDVPSPLKLHADRVQAFSMLPENIMISVLRAWKQHKLFGTSQWWPRLAIHLVSLPAIMHQAALKAAFPRIATHHSFHMHSDITAGTYEALVWPVLRQVRQLRCLDLSHSYSISSRILKQVFQHIDDFPFLQILNLTCNGITDETLSFLTPHIAKLSKLEELDLSMNNITGVGGAVLCKTLGPVNAIKYLDLSRNYALFHACTDFLPPVATLETLVGLDLSHIPLQKSGIKALSKNLQSLTGLKNLSLRNCLCNGDAIIALGPGVSALKASMVELCLGQNQVTCAGLEHFMPHLAAVTGLQHLDLAFNRLADDGMGLLALHLSSLQSLRQLIVGCNRISDVGVKAITPHLIQLPDLEFLDFRYNDLSAESAQALEPLLLPECHEWLLETRDSSRWRFKAVQELVRSGTQRFQIF